MNKVERGVSRDSRGTRIGLFAAAAAALLLGACTPAENDALLGALEWDRVAVPAELAEPVLHWRVAEGERVAAGDVLLELDTRRQDARIANARAALMEAEARLAELANGARIETIEAANANLARARAAEEDAEREYVRVAELRTRGLVAAAALDQAVAARDQRRAETRAAAAQLEELTKGTRPEQIEQASAAVAGARAALEELEVTRERLTVRAPRDGRVDALPFKPGDRPPAGATVASLLVGEAPYARVFVPAPKRAGLAPGDRFVVRVEGIERDFAAKLRTVRSEPSFTPYYALAGDDSTRLVFRAELVLEGDGVGNLPAGLPLTAVPAAGGAGLANAAGAAGATGAAAAR